MNDNFISTFEIEKVNDDEIVAINANMGIVIYKKIDQEFSFNVINLKNGKYKSYNNIPKKYSKLFDIMLVYFQLSSTNDYLPNKFVECLNFIYDKYSHRQSYGKTFHLASYLSNIDMGHYHCHSNFSRMIPKMDDSSTAIRRTNGYANIRYDSNADYYEELCKFAISKIALKNRVLFDCKFVEYGIKSINM